MTLVYKEFLPSDPGVIPIVSPHPQLFWGTQLLPAMNSQQIYGTSAFFSEQGWRYPLLVEVPKIINLDFVYTRKHQQQIEINAPWNSWDTYCWACMRGQLGISYTSIDIIGKCSIFHKICMYCFVLHCFALVRVPSFVDSEDLFTHILQDCLTGTGAISASEGILKNMGEIKWCLIIIKHNKAWTSA